MNKSGVLTAFYIVVFLYFCKTGGDRKVNFSLLLLLCFFFCSATGSTLKAIPREKKSGKVIY